MKTEQPIKCPYCGHVWHRDFTDADAYHTQVEECPACESEFAVRLVIRYDLQVRTFADLPAPTPTPEPKPDRLPISAVRFLLTDDQRRMLEPFVEELRKAREANAMTVTVGQLDACNPDNGYNSAWFAMFDQEAGEHMIEIMRPIWRSVKGRWIYDETEDTVFDVMDSETLEARP